MRALLQKLLTPKPASTSTLPLPAAPARVTLPRWILLETHRAFVPYWQAGVETALFWAGPDHGEQAVITTLVQPALRQTPGNYQVPPDARAQMARRLREQHLVIHAQVHTHPAQWIGHSAYDDAHAYSTAEGSLSVVWPAYGHTCTHDLSGLGIHVRHQGRWTQLFEPHDRARHLHVVDDHIDQRFSIHGGGINDSE